MDVQGTVAAGFEPVREVFADAVAASPGTGAAFAAWHDGAWVADLWGGYADAARTRPWREDTLVMPYSVTKPFAAVCVLVLADRGLVDLDAPMTTYWPALPGGATVRQVLAHTCGHVLLDAPQPEEAFYDWDLMCAALEQQQPTWHGSCARRCADRTTSTSTSAWRRPTCRGSLTSPATTRPSTAVASSARG